MRWFINLSTGAKLAFGFVLMMGLLAAAMLMAYSRITKIQASQTRLYQMEFANVRDLLQIRTQHNGLRAALLAMESSTSKGEMDVWKKDIDERTAIENKTTADLLTRNRGGGTFANQLEELNTIQKDYGETRQKEIIPQIYAGQKAEARKITLGIQLERYEKMRELAKQLGQEAEDRAQKAVEQSDEDAHNATQAFIIVGVIIFILGTLMAVSLSRMIAYPLRALSLAAEHIAAGDLSIKVGTSTRRDEVGVLNSAFNKMVANLREVNREITEGVNVLSSSANEISASTSQLASSAGETASAVTETTATIEEIRQTAQVTSQKARNVADAAQRAVNVAQKGQQATSQTTEGMQRIREQMEAIAEGMMRLSEQSQAIGQIIASVDDLAQQSNLLAVNASIEAAKAGEQGKGFAVVARK